MLARITGLRPHGSSYDYSAWARILGAAVNGAAGESPANRFSAS